VDEREGYGEIREACPMDRDTLNAQTLSQFGLLTRPQLLKHGVTGRFIEWRLSTKRWVTV